MDTREMIRSLIALGFTEQGIALTIDVHQSTISRILSGNIKDPKGSLVKAVKKIFDKYASTKVA